MPTLPTLTVTQAQADRMLAAYGVPGETQAQTIDRYKAWLTKQITDFVIAYEDSQDVAAFLAAKATKADQTRTDLTPSG